MKTALSTTCIFCLFACVAFNTTLLMAQSDSSSVKEVQEKPEHVLIDPTDGQFDLSYYMISMSGFIPVPMLITEPSLGGIGGALGAVFMRKPDSEAMAESRKKYKSPGWPDTWIAGGMYTANNSWAVGGGRIGSFPKIGLHYRVVAAYADINMNFYRTSKISGNEIDFDMKLRTVPIILQVTKDFLYYFNAGIRYTYSYTRVSSNQDYSETPFSQDFIEYIENKGLNVNKNSMLTALLTFDNRDNVFTPNDGAKVDVNFEWAAKALGGEFNYTNLEVAGYGYKTILKNRWVGGLRMDYQQVFNDAPFYALPFVDLRGVPAMRYQNNIVALAEMEHRVRIYKRWSLIGFAGVSNAFSDYKNFSDGQFVWNAGGGFRYLIASAFNLHMGLDAGAGPKGDWGIYVIFGSNWLR